MQFVFILCEVEGYRNILKLSCKPIAFTSYKAFLKNKRRPGTSFPASFSTWFSKKNILLVTFYSRDIGQYVYCNRLLTRL